MKKIISLILCMVMVLGLAVTGVGRFTAVKAAVIVAAGAERQAQQQSQ